MKAIQNLTLRATHPVSHQGENINCCPLHGFGYSQAPDAHGTDYSINTPHAIRAKLEHERPPHHAASDAAVDGSVRDEAVTLSPEPSHFEKHARKVVVSLAPSR